MFPSRYTGIFKAQSWFLPAVGQKGCSYSIAPEQKARMTYDNILRFADDPDVRDPIKFLREREIVHFQRFGEAKPYQIK